MSVALAIPLMKLVGGEGAGGGGAKNTSERVGPSIMNKWCRGPGTVNMHGHQGSNILTSSDANRDRRGT